MANGQDPWWTRWSLKYADDVYGKVYGGHSVQQATYNTLIKWLPAYIAEFNRKLGGQILQNPREYYYTYDERTLPKDVCASVQVTVDGTQEAPQRDQRTTRSTWRVQVAVFVFGTRDWQETQALVYAYGTAVRTAIAQHPALGGLAETTLWVGEKYSKLARTSTRNSGLAVVQFDVTLAQTMDVFAGPPTPGYQAEGIITDPTQAVPGPIPIALTHNVEVDNIEADEQIGEL